MWLQSSCFPFCIRKFLLTHPVWDVTRDWSSLELQHSISTHTSRVGCDGYCFYRRNELGISTHTSRVGCDFGNIYARCNTFHFYSHIPCGMWHQPKPPQHQQEGFLLTHPVWDVTQNVCHVFFYTSISTHTSRVGCDSRMQLGFSCIFISTHTSRVGCDFSAPSSTPTITYFYSHIPCGMWPSSRIFSIASPTISTHTSRVGCDLHCQTCITCSYISTHTSRVGCD